MSDYGKCITISMLMTCRKHPSLSLAHAIRGTASEEYRALITYNTDSNDYQKSRDEIYAQVLAHIIQGALVGHRGDLGTCVDEGRKKTVSLHH